MTLIHDIYLCQAKDTRGVVDISSDDEVDMAACTQGSVEGVQERCVVQARGEGALSTILLVYY